MTELAPGTEGVLERTVEAQHTTRRGDYHIFSTPNLVLLLEEAAIEALAPYLRDYECPAGSAVFFTEALKHGGPVWKRKDPRIAILHTYTQVAICWHRLAWIDQAILDGLPPLPALTK